MALTDIAVKNAKPKEKTYYLFDGAGGLYLEIAPGGGRYWRKKYRFQGKERRLALGVYPTVGLKEARDRLAEAGALLARGIDPIAHKHATQEATIAEAVAKQAEEANTFRALAEEWFRDREHTWAPGHARTVKLRLENELYPWLGDRPVNEITAAELLVVLRRVKDRGALETAHRLKVIAGQVFRFAISTARATRDVSADLRGALPSPKEGHFKAILDPKRIGEVLRMFDGYSGSFVVRCALQLGPMFGVRPGELRQAEWKDIDFEKGEWRFVVSKTDTAHIVPLSRQAMSILTDLHKLTGASGWVFPGARNNGRPMSENAVLAAYRALGLTKEELVGHGWRASFRTLGEEELGIRPEILEQQLSHKVRDPLGRAYNRTTFLAERRDALQSWANYIDRLKAGDIPKPKPLAEVIDIAIAAALGTP